MAARLLPARGSRWTRVSGSLSRAEWRRAAVLALVIVALHVIGFVCCWRSWCRSTTASASGVFGLGIGITAYTLGMRHAFDADHIAAIDNTTRKLMNEGQRPLSVGFFFSLGHSTIVFALAACSRSASAAERRGRRRQLDAAQGHRARRPGASRALPVADRDPQPGRPGRHRAVFRRMRQGDFDEAELEEHSTPAAS